MERYRRHSPPRPCVAARDVAGRSGRDRFRRRGLEIVSRPIEGLSATVRQVERQVPNLMTNLLIFAAR